MTEDKEPESAGFETQQGRDLSDYQHPFADQISDFVDMVRSALFEVCGSYFPEWVSTSAQMLTRIAAGPIGKTLELGDMVEEWRRYADEVAHIDKFRQGIEEREVLRKRYGKRLIASARIVVQKASTLLLQDGKKYTDPQVLLNWLDRYEEQLQRQTFVMEDGAIVGVWDTDG